MCKHWVKVQTINHRGDGVVFLNSKRHTVADAVPGDFIQVEKKKSRQRRRKKELRLVRRCFSAYKRLAPFCLHYRYCGGCSRQVYSYKDQLAIKNRLVKELLQRIDASASFFTIEPCKRTTYYRNRIDYSFSNMRWILDTEDIKDRESLDRRALGLHVRGFYDRVVQLQHCFLHPSNQLRKSIDSWAREQNAGYYNNRNETGWLRALSVRSAHAQNKKLTENNRGNSNAAVEPQIAQNMCILSLAYSDEQKLRGLLHYLSQINDSAGISSFYTVINEKKNDDIQDLPLAHQYGAPYIVEHCGHIDLRIYPKVFFQTNSAQAELLYKIVRSFVAPKQDQTVLDLYCGIGSIALFLARDLLQVRGVDIVADSIKTARENAAINKIMNAEFFCLPAEELLSASQSFLPVDAIVVDPPRAGLHDKVLQFLKLAAVKTIVYVSCNPFALVKDLEQLCSVYALEACQPVDMFPHTPHVEVVVKLTRKKR